MKREHNTIKRAAIATVTVALIATSCAGDDDVSSDTGQTASRNADVPTEQAGTGVVSDTDEVTSDVAASPTENSREAMPSVTVAASQESSDGTFFDEDAGDADDEFVDDEEPEDRETSFDGAVFEDYGQRTFVATGDDPLSTFSLDVDTGSYSVTRAALENGSLPPATAIRPEEFINAFDYRYPHPDHGLTISIDGAPSPFDTGSTLVRVGVSSMTVEERPPVALTFIVDTSGSMDSPNRLPLVKESLEILVEELDDDDTVAIVTYSDESGVVLRPTPISERDAVLDAIDDLETGGSTNLEAGLDAGYELADEAFRDDGVNRVVLASDGIANVGLTDPDGLADRIRSSADRGINLVTLGFGMEGYNDVTMEQIANEGDGFYGYIDTEDEADRLFRDELTASLITVAKDAKIQVEFDPQLVDEYRLIGYENRGVADSDFRNDDVDAGEIGAGHESTALYELRLRDAADDGLNELGVVSLRWEDPDSGEVTEIDADIDGRDLASSWDDTTSSLRLATVVTGFAELLRYNEFATDYDFDDLEDAADELADELDSDQVDQLADLIDRANSIAN